MPGRGRPPSDKPMGRERDERRKREQFTKVADDGQVRGPDLPDYTWHERTVAWYETWRRSPMAATFIAADWDFLIDTAMLHTEMWNGSPGLAAEIRLRVGKLAGTPEDRLRLRLEVETESKQVAQVTSMSRDRKQRLVAIVNE